MVELLRLLLEFLSNVACVGFGLLLLVLSCLGSSLSEFGQALGSALESLVVGLIGYLVVASVLLGSVVAVVVGTVVRALRRRPRPGGEALATH